MTELLDFEEQWPKWSGRKDDAIRAHFGEFYVEAILS